MKNTSGCPQIENAIYNWYLAGENADPYPIVNAFAMAMKEELELILPAQNFGSASLENLDIDLDFLNELPAEDMNFTKVALQLLDDEQGRYWLPIYTNETEVDPTQDVTLLPMPVKDVLENAVKWPGCAGAVINPWGKDIHLDPDFISQIKSHEPLSHMTLAVCPIDKMHTDAKVEFNPYRKNTGLAYLSDKIDRTVQYTIETASPIYSGKYSDERLLAACYRNALNLALEKGCQSIAVPLPMKYPAEKAVEIASSVVVKWFVAHKGAIIDLYFVCRNEEERDTYNTYFDSDKKIPQHVRDLRMGAEAYNEGEFEQAYILYSAAAEAGNVTALSNLGYCYYFGRGVAEDKKKAYECWENAAALGDACALYKMGDLHMNGEIRKDAAEALHYYIRSFNIAKADKDLFAYPDVCLRLAKYYGDVLKPRKRDYLIDEAIKYFRKRVEKGTSYTEGILKEAEDLKAQYES